MYDALIVAKDKINAKSALFFAAIFFTLVLFPAPTHAALITASGVLGQADFVTGTAANPPTAQSENASSYTAIDTVNHRLFVADASNNRVLIYPLDSNNDLTSATNESATYVFGQPDFISKTAAVGTQNGLNLIHGIAYDSNLGRLFVADQGNNRILIFDAKPATLTANGYNENAEYVIGQSNYSNHGTANGTTGLNTPRGIAYDPTNDRIFVSDGNNSRVMIFDVRPATLIATPAGEPASYVVGTSDFNFHSGTTTQTGLSGPLGLSYDSVNDRIFVSDGANINRIMIFDVSPTNLASVSPGFGTALSAIYVIGKSNFTSTTAADTQTGLHTARSSAYDPVNNRLFVADSVNARIMIYDVSPANLTSVNPGFGTALSAENVIGQSDFVSRSSNTTANTFFLNVTGPRGPTYNPANNTLFVIDTENNRTVEISMIHITTSSLSAGNASFAYSQTVATTNAQGSSQSFALYSGSLPAGLSLNTSTGEISGIPTATGTSTFTIEADDTFSTGNMFDRASFSITINPSYTLTYTAGSNGSLTGTSPQTVASGGDGTSVTAVPASHYHFVNWSDASTSNPRTDTAVSGDVTVTANFAIDTYTLTYTAGAHGSITGTHPQTVDYGADGSTVTAVPASHYHFVDWSDGVLTASRTDTNITANVTVTANFAIDTYTLTYIAGANGSLTGTSPQTVNYGADGTSVTAVPDVGYHFVNWSDASTANPRTDTNITADLTLTANFAINTYNLSYSAGANGSLSGTTSQTVDYGSDGTPVTPLPDTGYHFVNWSDASTANPRTDTTVTGNITVTANFTIDLTITTDTATSLSSTSAKLNGTLIDLGGSTVTDEGFNYGTSLSYGTSLHKTHSISLGAYFLNTTAALSCGTLYHFQAFAVNSYGTALGSDQMFTTSACSAPSVSTTAATLITTTTAELNGTITNTGGSSITSRGFDWGTDTGYGTTVTQTGTFGATTFNTSLTTLSCSTTYHYRAYAINTTGRTDGGDLSFPTTPCSATAYTFTGPSSGSVNTASTTFTVTPNSTYSGTITITPTGGGLSTPIVLAFSSSTPQTFTITPTSIGTVTLIPTNSGSLANPTTLAYTALATVPGAPTSVTATPGNAQATVSFTAPAANGATITLYTVTSIPSSITATGTASPIIVTGLSNGTSYTFTVTATNSAGTGSPSSPSNAVTPTAPVVVVSGGGGGGGGGGSYSAPTPTIQGTVANSSVLCSAGDTFSKANGQRCTTFSPLAAFIFTKSLKLGMTDPQVKELQKYLNAHKFTVALAGPGSAGNETAKFGAATLSALIKLQKANHIDPAVGFFGAVTRGVVNGR